MPDRETSSFIHDSSLIFGRNEETEMVAQNICNKDIGKFDNGEIRVYGIWGMGGVGKTTLAQLVYNHDMVNKYFNLKCWVYVSENFQVKEILKNIIESIDNCGCTLTLLDKLQEYLQSKLRGKKFVIVLDDVWIEEGERIKWNKLRETLSCGAEESVILMTTRYQTTSQMMAKVPELQHELGCLSEKDSGLLFKKHAFADGRVGGDISELEPIGRKIVEKCKGLPLAVKTLGSLMWSKSSISERLATCERQQYMGVERKQDLACFEKDVLIPLWVSNGFIPRKGETDLYALGEEIFNCLVWRSFFQTVKADSKWDRAIRYKMHDLMHDMARYVSGHDYWIIESGKDLIFHDEVLHFSSQCPDIQFSPGFLGNLTSLRSIFMYGKLNECAISQLFNHGYLRVIYLADMFSRLPESLSKLKHLKYLSLSNSSIHLFPRSLMYLQNLQVLVLISCYNLIELPDSICKLKHLKYLNLSHSSIEVLPESIMYLQNLQVLLLFSCKQLRWLPRGLRYMVNLQRLDIRYCKNRGIG
ncbi:putative P-loop containing nucleoside triphosphate hydrolase, leucine-rich repeat domain superfamily [Helianthus annuus]|nr:putative P-loop containing nucleoside triphosphate hydrolase, leucine-rich repeat domain superfamily [Helianthus annuus]